METRCESALYNGEVSFFVANCYELSLTFIARDDRKRAKEDYTAYYNLIISVIRGLIKSLFVWRRVDL